MSQPLSVPVCQHIGIFVRNLEVMSRFYREELGFQLVKEYMVEPAMMQQIFAIPSAARIQYLELNSFGIELFDFQNVTLAQSTKEVGGYNHWTIFVNDKEAFCSAFEKKGFEIIRVVKPHGFTYFMKDPEANLLEIKSYAEPVSQPKKGY